MQIRYLHEKINRIRLLFQLRKTNSMFSVNRLLLGVKDENIF